MKLFEILKRSFVVLMLSFMAVGMLGACSSSEEEAPPAESTGGGGSSEDCAAQCQVAPDHQHDECIALCMGEI